MSMKWRQILQSEYRLWTCLCKITNDNRRKDFHLLMQKSFVLSFMLMDTDTIK